LNYFHFILCDNSHCATKYSLVIIWPLCFLETDLFYSLWQHSQSSWKSSSAVSAGCGDLLFEEVPGRNGGNLHCKCELYILLMLTYFLM